ncbi:MAG: hypothetical protein A2X36_17260 [Elusimicrobia bacterium GWA2_69_24]|nr:MAG: hypothetical protein A2X36_17260 [Elusimicrobia bacterium GWA2_69_24]
MLGLLLVLLSLPALAADDPLREAADRCGVEELKRLFDSGEAQAHPAGWNDPLILRIAEGHFCGDPARHEAAMVLAVERGLSLKTRDGYAKSILSNVAMWPGKTYMAEWLIQRGADVDARDSSENTPLFHATLHGAVNNVKLLLLKGADPKAANKWKETPLDWAKKEHQDEVAEILEAAVAGRMPSPPPKAVVRRSAPPAAPPPAAARSAPPPVERPDFRLPPRPDDFALVVGVETYSNELPKAEFAERDAEAVRAHLAALGVPERNIKVLLGAKASRGQLEAYIEDWLPRMAKPSGRVFFYFSGHGAPDPKSGDAFLVPVDGDPKFLARTAYPLKRLYASLGALKAGPVIVALDSCFSGGGGRSVLAEGARPLVNQVSAAPPSASQLTVLTATAPDETTGTMKEAGHGIFTYYLLQGLRSAAGRPSRTLTAQALYDSLKPQVQDEASRQNRDQTPGLSGPGGVALIGP